MPAKCGRHRAIFTIRFQFASLLSLTFDFVQPQPEPAADRVTLFADVILPLPLMLGVKRLGLASGEGRLRVDEHREEEIVEGQES